MSYTCEVSDSLFSAFPRWSFVIFTVILLLGALISFITGASGIIFNWVLDFYQSIFHSNLRRIHPLEVVHRV